MEFVRRKSQIARKRERLLAIVAKACIAIAFILPSCNERPIPGPILYINWDNIAANLREIRIYVDVPNTPSETQLWEGPCLYKISSEADIKMIADGLRAMKQKKPPYPNLAVKYWVKFITSTEVVDGDYEPGRGLRIWPGQHSRAVWFWAGNEFDAIMSKHMENATRIYQEHYK